ncbi:hypothetical protein SpCBS45565_g01324 [Spizellomyces sp. 'palustris']|nr:hypothetical protein SpCBS45565_g01324 [Spizellomyces sp. 'palustris']
MPKLSLSKRRKSKDVTRTENKDTASKSNSRKRGNASERSSEDDVYGSSDTIDFPGSVGNGGTVNVQRSCGDEGANPRPTTPNPRPSRKIVGPYRLSKTLGQGSMGKVKLAVHMVTGEKRACKIIPRPSGTTPLSEAVVIGPTKSIRNLPVILADAGDGHREVEDSKEARIIREAAIMLLLHHPHIVRLYEVVLQDENYYMFLEYVNGGQMLDYIISHGKLKEKQARRYIRQIVSAIDYCHRNSIVHRDLKIENVLIDKDGSIKLIDFGLSNLYSPTSQLQTFCGSLYFAAPELLCAKAYIGPEVDIWSLGVILYVLVCGKVPFDDASMPMLHAKIKAGAVDYPPDLSDECRHLISRLLVVQTERRASMAELRSHPWLTRGYDGPPNSYLPSRPRLESPPDSEVVKRMRGFDFGTEETICSTLDRQIKERDVRRGRNPSESTLPSEPMLSIYHLVKEKMHRESWEAAMRPPTRPKPVVTTSLSQDPPLTCRAASSAESHMASAENRAREAAGSDATRWENTSRKTSQSSARMSEDVPLRSEPSPRRSFTNMMRRFSTTIARTPLPQSTASPVHSGAQATPSTSHQSMLTSFVGNRSSSIGTLDDPRVSNVGTLSGRPGRADEFVRTVSLKGLLSVVNSSTKSPSTIRQDLLQVLHQEKIFFVEYYGGFDCEFVADISKGTRNTDDGTGKASKRRYSFMSLASLRRSLDMSSGDRNEAQGSERHQQRDLVATPKPVPLPKPPAPVRIQSSGLRRTSLSSLQTGTSSQMLRMEIFIVKIPWLGLHGIQFRRITGDTWRYKAVCARILDGVRL